jgi:hypothetical protein
MKKTLILTMALVLTLSGFAFAGDINTPIAHWAFDEGSGVVAHNSAGTGDGTISGATWAAGKIGNALRFDGVNDYVNCGHNAALGGMNAITVSAWINADTWKTGQGARVISKMGSAAFSYDMSIYDNGSRTTATSFYGQNGAITTFTTTPNFALNQWYFLTATDTGSVQKLYVNGILMNTQNTNTGAIFGNDSDIWIGEITNNYVSSTAFDGIIDDVRIYNYALSAEDVGKLYNVPEPATLLLFGIAGLVLRNKK